MYAPHSCPQWWAREYAPTPPSWREATAIIRGACVYAPWPCTPLKRTTPLTHTLHRCAHPHGHARTMCAPSLSCVPPLPCTPHVCTPLCRARFSHLCAPLLCAPPECKSHKLVVHSTTWASGPLATERWLIVGCLGGDHYFYIHSHNHAQGCTCMQVIFHVLFIYIHCKCLSIRRPYETIGIILHFLVLGVS